jgi:hypothetical protein
MSDKPGTHYRLLPGEQLQLYHALGIARVATGVIPVILIKSGDPEGTQRPTGAMSM